MKSSLQKSAPRLPKLPLRLAGVVGLFFALACGCGDAFKEGWDQGMSQSADQTISEARASVAACVSGPDQAALDKVLDNVERGLADGSLSGINANVIGGMVTGASEDGCQPEDIEVISSVYPDIVN